MDNEYYMKIALEEARRGFDMGEVPIGCIIVYEGEIIGRGANERATRKNVLCHAEITAISQACDALGDWRLEGCRLYVTLEPCPMCAGAIVQARIPVVVYGAKSPKAGCVGSIYNLLDEPRFNHQAEVISGVCEDECANLMSEFMQTLRKKDTNKISR
ncbi:MAG: tRNA adenosine(34) deaminase TadA [Defluviitaleaceae bacterium]|nr:tRNA adenosine(34) deaminase TadA [Defluviitaleaceae bacterium]MCL2264116.1 tRNA adenosine(34) deaminase TadA [Defluviitaleaceae bacterium]